MKSHLAEYFSTVRRNKGIGLAQLAKMIGYKNVSKGSRRIDQFERWSVIHEDLLRKLAAALDIDNQTVARLIEQDRQRYVREWNEWVNTPIRPTIVLGHIGGIGWTEPLPEGITREAAEEYTATVAKEKNKPILLVMSRRLSIQFDRNGNRTSVNETKPGEVNVPYLVFGRRKAIFNFGTGKMQVLNEPQKPGPEKVVTDFGGVQVRSNFEVVEEEPGQVTFSVEGLVFEPSDTETDAPNILVGLRMVMEAHEDAVVDEDKITELRDRLNVDEIAKVWSCSTDPFKKIPAMLGEIEDQLLARGIIQGPKQYQ
jgi:hypothetical protein